MTYEFVPTFLSNDASFCLRDISASDKSVMGESDPWDLAEKRWETSDKYCESVMNFIMTFNDDAGNGRRMTTIWLLRKFSEQPGCVSPPYFIDGNPLPERWSLRGQEPESGDLRVEVWQLENRQFPGCITVPETTAAAKVDARDAQMALDVVAGALRLSYFTDGSVEPPLQGEARDKFVGVRGGYGVVSKIPFLKMGADEWHEEAFFTDNAFSIDHMEMAGISQCLRNALDFVDQSRTELSARNVEAVKVDVFTDSTSSLEAIKNGIQPRLGKTDLYTPHVLPIVKTVVCLTLHARNSNAELHWVPRCSVRKHERADALAGLWKSDKNPNVNID
ncbi:hypothetical protein B0T26DRAFT_750890 [Lasiosphaeria miniovina]|uniref:Uncharacterized protein n=1 Tax=Lasiosphaeria miniovina TaxID=1954250 RepID=A0AA40AIZ7_9PEZI|nr:uncharacterized protein B0T26DRAFT_750890 [Lasiosphaeria miniovina]KAK0716746.1 hypothetical protein B0T26DRAFT_750890 [Lasiosphaeria miniovina]